MTDATAHAEPFRLDARGVVCRRGERTLFAPVDLSLAGGSVVWLRGANGQGKTTLLRTLAGLAAPAAGSIERAPRTRVAFVGHAGALKDDLTAIEALAFLAALDVLAPRAPRDALAAALATLGIESRRDAPVRTLSQGQRRRVALARLALPGAPPLWLLDEPFDALDTAGIETLNALLGEHVRRGGSVVLTSHGELSLASSPPAIVALQPP